MLRAYRKPSRTCLLAQRPRRVPCQVPDARTGCCQPLLTVLLLPVLVTFGSPALYVTVLLNPSTARSLSILSNVILLSDPPMFTLPHVPLTVRVLLVPPTVSDLPLAQSMSAVVPTD